MRGVDHGSDVQQRNAPRVQVRVNVIGDLLWRPTPREVVADEVRLPDECLFRLGRSREADGAQLCQVCVISGIGSRDRSATKQGGASHHGDGKSGQPARCGHSIPFLLLAVSKAANRPRPKHQKHEE